MARVLVVEDDPATRRLVALHLESQTHEVITAEDGLEGLRAAIESMPDLIVSDNQMPNVDGIGLLAGIRSNTRTAAIPFIFLTSTEESEVRTRSKMLGVSDILVKPFNRARLLDAVARQISLRDSATRIDVLLQPPEGEVPEEAFDDQETVALAPVYASLPPGSATARQRAIERAVDGSVVFFAIKDFSRIAETLDEDMHVALISAFYDNVREVVSRNAGWIVKSTEGGFIAMFDGSEGRGSDHAARAIKTAVLCVLGLQHFGPWIARRLGQRELPALAATAGVHSGPVSVCSLSGGRNGERSERTIIGDAVNVASRLQSSAAGLGWSVVCSAGTLALGGPRFGTDRRGHIVLKGRTEELGIVEIVALNPRPGADGADTAFYNGVSEAIRANTSLIEAQRAIETGVMDPQTPAGLPSPTITAPILIDGYRLLKKIGEGGVAQVHLAEHVASGESHVLKIVAVSHDDEGEIIQRFIQEYALLSQIDHPNVARIHQQGFAGNHAFIAMEYFPGGDLRGLMREGSSPELAIAALLQVAGGLAAVHRTGIVHRDLKPDNIMIREDGSLAIADFGIAKNMRDAHGPTRHGDIVGTPYYLSPEQALGIRTDQRADIYSLGVMFYEMLTGRRAYTAESAMELLHRHAHDAVPLLPPHLARYQTLLERMMCKQVEGRFRSASRIINFIIESGLA